MSSPALPPLEKRAITDETQVFVTLERPAKDGFEAKPLDAGTSMRGYSRFYLTEAAAWLAIAEKEEELAEAALQQHHRHQERAIVARDQANHSPSGVAS